MRFKLCGAEVDFVIVGGVAAMLHGSAHFTNDLDVFYSRIAANLKKLKGALAPFHPRPRGFPDDLPFVWDEVTLRNATVLTLRTDLGRNRSSRGSLCNGNLPRGQSSVASRRSLRPQSYHNRSAGSDPRKTRRRSRERPLHDSRTGEPDGSGRRNLSPYRSVPSTSLNQSGRFSTSRGLLPSGGPMMPSRCIMSRMRAARP